MGSRRAPCRKLGVWILQEDRMRVRPAGVVCGGEKVVHSIAHWRRAQTERPAACRRRVAGPRRNWTQYQKLFCSSWK